MRIKITDHNPPGATFITPNGVVHTDADGVADVTPEQLAHLKSQGHLQITTREMGCMTTRDVKPRSKKKGAPE